MESGGFDNSNNLDGLNLTYTVEKKSKKVIELNNEIKSIQNKIIGICVILTLCIVYFIIFNDRYISYIDDYLDNVHKHSSFFM